jgi:DNA-binding GntR family transcriptional regulator
LPPAPASIRPVRSAGGAAREAYARLRGDILAGRLRPGDPLSENDAARELGMSRTPVREAFIRLESESLLTVRPQVGTVVAPIDVAAVADGQFVREAIECRSVSLASTRASAQDGRELREQLDLQARAITAGDHASFLALDDAMHRLLLRISGHARVWHAIEDLKAQFDRVRLLSLEDPAWLKTIHAQHEEIAHHVLAGDADAAAEAMRAHLSTVYASIDRIAAAHPEYFRREPAPETAASA